jgi:hypothetical protein
MNIVERYTVWLYEENKYRIDNLILACYVLMFILLILLVIVELILG